MLEHDQNACFRAVGARDVHHLRGVFAGEGLPTWLATYGPYFFAMAGTLVGVFLALLLAAWLPVAFCRRPPPSEPAG